METETKNLLRFLILPLLILAVVVFIAQRQNQPDYLLHVSFLDVGQGDAMFIQTYQGAQILIDGGPSDKVLSELGKKMPFWDRTLDLVILTHPDADHSSGLIDVLKRYEVKKVLLTHVTAPTATFKQFSDALEAEHAEKIYAEEGERLWLDSATVFDVYYPPKGVETDKSLSTNNTGIVGKLSFGKTRILFTADTDSVVEDIVRAQFDMGADILKVGHHGSKYSSSVEFIKAVAPTFGVIEVGVHNTYGHPTQSTLDNLAGQNVKIFRTDQDRNIEFTSDGRELVKK